MLSGFDLRGSKMEDEYTRLVWRMNSPRVVIDNDACEHATIIEVISGNRHGILLEVVQVLMALDLIITKAYISSDGEWLMDVFNVTDRDGNKIRDEQILKYIKKTLETDICFLKSLTCSVGMIPTKDHTSIELTGADRPGFLSEVSAVLRDLRCNVVSAEFWTHNTRAAAIIDITDQTTGYAIEDPRRLCTIKDLLTNVLKNKHDLRAPSVTIYSSRSDHKQIRLHQMMFADRDFERREGAKDKIGTHVTVLDCKDRGYTVVTLRSRDRPNLLFDTLCSLTDMQYVVFHGTIITGGMEACQEFYVRHVDGLPMGSEAERQRVIDCLEAAVERRATQGVELDLSTSDRFGLLSDATRIFRENGLCIKRAEISTEKEKAKDTFLVTEVSGRDVENQIIEMVRAQIGQTTLQVKEGRFGMSPKRPKEKARSFLFGDFLKSRGV